MNRVPMVKLCGLSAAMFLTGCVAAVPAATEQEKTNAARDYIACLHSAARKMDDGKSDAATIAMAIKSVCAGEFEKSVRVTTQGKNLQVQRLVAERMEGRQIEIATMVVLDARKGQGKSN